jgi:ubiquinone biosynthesis protein UbiJ
MLERLFDAAVGNALSASPRATALCAALEGRSVTVHCDGAPAMRVTSTGKTLRLSRGDGNAADTGTVADATLRGGALSLLLLGGPDAQAVIQRGDVKIDGDVEIAQQFRELFTLLRPDLEESLSRLVGPVPSHLLMQGLRSGLAWGRHVAHTSITNVAEYLAHERRTLVSRAESEHFMREVEQLRERLDRMDAQLTLLERRSTAAAGGPAPGDG